MAGHSQYVTLVSSLPHLGWLFSATDRPLTRVQLDKRLRLLAPPDAETLAAIEDVLRWHAADITAADAFQAERARRLVARLEHRTLLEITRRRLEMRTIVGALRRRRDGYGLPSPPDALGYHRRLDRIVRHWTDADLGVGASHPWIGTAAGYVRDGEAMALEKLLLHRGWRDLDFLGHGHFFDFPAVAIYVLKWDLMDRWMRYDAEQAAARFDNLVQAALDARGPLIGREGAARG